MPSIYCISGFNEYIIENKILYKKACKIKMKNGNWQYREKRKIKKVNNNGITGYILVKNNKRKFYSLERLRHRLKK